MNLFSNRRHHTGSILSGVLAVVPASIVAAPATYTENRCEAVTRSTVSAFVGTPPTDLGEIMAIKGEVARACPGRRVRAIAEHRAVKPRDRQARSGVSPGSTDAIVPARPNLADRSPDVALPPDPSQTWVRAFRDRFNGAALNPRKWNNGGKHQNDVWNAPSNVWLNRGKAVLRLASRTSGAMLYSGPVDGIGANHYQLPVGGFVEARIRFPGPGTTPGATLYNWPAWWTVGTDDWPTEGEIDIAEASPWRASTPLSANYHSPSAHIGYYVPDKWTNAYHVYGAHRRNSAVDFYYDGRLITTLPTSDNGAPHSLVFNHGLMEGQTPVTGAAARVRVDWVRAWEQPSSVTSPPPLH